jgi:hypothetical protein
MSPACYIPPAMASALREYEAARAEVFALGYPTPRLAAAEDAVLTAHHAATP